MDRSRTDYHSYLKLTQLLDCQKPKSAERGQPSHDELLFIIVHQAYELWFKQILSELDSVLNLFGQPKIREKDMGLIVARLERVTEIQKVLVDQINILETMTPLDFLDFRDLLVPASGFQSLQFRLIENKLGLKADARLSYNQSPYREHLPKDQIQQLVTCENEPSIFDRIEAWLERTPFLSLEEFDFWKSYREAVEKMFQREKQLISENEFLGPEDKKRNLEIVSQSEKTFCALFDEKQYAQLRESGFWRLSYNAIRAALFIQIYRDQPVLHLPFRLITALINIDELMTTWRHRHALMVRRMLGTKVGTGGSSGFQYLKDSADKHKIFNDFFQLTTFFIRRSDLPSLPEKVEKKLGFFYEH